MFAVATANRLVVKVGSSLVTNEGRYVEGQAYGVKGTHTVNKLATPGFAFDLNLQGYATAIMQRVGDEVTDAQVRTVALIAAARELAGLVRRDAPILPHRMFANKACPGDKAVAREAKPMTSVSARAKVSERPACTPGSVETMKFRTVISLGARSPVPSSSLPTVS